MVSRCRYRPGYADRGIRVCEEWKSGFPAFKRWALGHGYAPGLSIDRRNNDGPYSPRNCRWSTRTEQGRNKRNNVLVEAWGERRCLSEWAADPRCQVNASTLGQRVRFLRWPVELAIVTPPLPPALRGQGQPTG
jgi:hypothetical protein